MGEESMSEDSQPASQFLAFLSRHLVALVVEYDAIDDEGKGYHRGALVYSGFVLSLHDRWFWVTAGHCIWNNEANGEKEHGLDQLLATGRIRILNSGFADYFGSNAEHRHSVPFHYEQGCSMHLFRKDLGLDFALIPLPDLTHAAFERNGIIAVSRRDWVHQPSLTFSHFKILGFPSHLVVTSQSADGNLDMMLQPAMFVVERLDPSEVEGIPTDTWFIGKIPADVTIKDIRGMSGGPIYGLRKSDTGSWYYHVVALQSWWRKESRIVFGCSLPAFAEALHSIMIDPELPPSPTDESR
jgi:hypothetical protein